MISRYKNNHWENIVISFIKKIRNLQYTGKVVFVLVVSPLSSFASQVITRFMSAFVTTEIMSSLVLTLNMPPVVIIWPSVYHNICIVRLCVPGIVVEFAEHVTVPPFPTSISAGVTVISDVGGP